MLDSRCVDTSTPVLDRVMRLTASEIEPMLSEYLAGGWRDDNLELQSVDVEPGAIAASLRVTRHFTPGDGRFHLSVPQAFVWISQLAIIHGCWDNRLVKKPGEILVRRIAIACKSPVHDIENISFVMKLISKRAVPDGMFYSGEISINDRAFVGIGKYVFPMPERR